MMSLLFKLNDVQEREVKQFMEEEGYTSKTEFFRFLIKFYKYHKSPLNNRYEDLTDALKKVIVDLDKKGKLSKTLEEQLEDV